MVMVMNRHLTPISPISADYARDYAEDDLIMINRHRRLPSSVTLKHHRQEADNVDSSEGTSTTFMGTSPVSSEQNTQFDAMLDQRQSVIPMSVSHWMNGEHIIYSQKQKRENSHHHSRRSKSIIEDKEKQHKSRRTNKMNKYQTTLTWRMDPSISLSDFTLTFIGIDDHIAIQKYMKRKKMKRSKRRDKWIVDGLYLDRSQSSDEEDDENHDSQYRASGNHNDHPTISRMKTCNNTVVEHYHLHRVNLAVGQSGCDYFARLFREKDDISSSSSSNHNQHSVEIPLACLPAIPAMLDYLYDPHPKAQVHATTATAVPLRYLATYFGNRLLFDLATQFLHEDLRPATAIEYLQHAELFRQEKLGDVCIRICAESFDQLKVTWFASLSPQLMIRILHSRYFQLSINRHVVCSRIASYCRCQMHNIDRKDLLSLTNAKIMPKICPEEALFFIQLMIRLGIAMDDLLHDDNSKERNLYERCIDAAPEVIQSIIDSACLGSTYNTDRIQKWHNIPSRQTKNARGDYCKLPPQIKVQLLEYALAHQQNRKLVGTEV
jgi:hypothetical protein